MIPNYEENGPPLTDPQVLQFVEWFDFDKVHKTMVALDWKWAQMGTSDQIPSVVELKRTASYLLYQLGPNLNSISTGGFEVHRRNGTVTLNFNVATWEEYETEEDRVTAFDPGLPVPNPTTRKLTI